MASVAVSGAVTIYPAEPYMANRDVYSFSCSIRCGYDIPGRTVYTEPRCSIRNGYDIPGRTAYTEPCCSIRSGYDRPGLTQQRVRNVNDGSLCVIKLALRGKPCCSIRSGYDRPVAGRKTVNLINLIFQAQRYVLLLPAASTLQIGLMK